MASNKTFSFAETRFSLYKLFNDCQYKFQIKDWQITKQVRKTGKIMNDIYSWHEMLGLYNILQICNVFYSFVLFVLSYLKCSHLNADLQILSLGIQTYLLFQMLWHIPKYISGFTKERKEKSRGKKKKKSRTTKDYISTKERIGNQICQHHLVLKNNTWSDIASNYAIFFQRCYCWAFFFPLMILIPTKTKYLLCCKPMYIIKFLWTSVDVCGSFPNFPQDFCHGAPGSITSELA